MPVILRLEGAAPLARALARSPAAVAAAQRQAMTASLLLIEADARRNVRQDTRRLQNSLTHRILERGSRPHLPPVAALRGWARRHGVSPYAVQRAIGRRGTRARPFLLPAFTRSAPRIVRLFAQAG